MIRAATKHQAVQKQRCERSSLFYLSLEKHQRNKLLSLLLPASCCSSLQHTRLAERCWGRHQSCWARNLPTEAGTKKKKIKAKCGFSCTGQLP